MPSQTPRARGGGGRKGGCDSERREIERAMEGGRVRGKRCKTSGGGGYVHQSSVTGVRYAHINVLHLHARPHTHPITAHTNTILHIESHVILQKINSNKATAMNTQTEETFTYVSCREKGAFIWNK